MKQSVTPERHPIIIVGAGASGIATGIKLKELGIHDFLILERADGPGGTWYNNRYPGLACDIPSHLYCFSFEQKSDWSRSHAYQQEIGDYLAHCVDKYGIGPHIRYNQSVDAVKWDDEADEWQLTTGAGETLITPVFVSAIGMFNEVQWPDIAGLDSFAGRTEHSALWPDNIDLTGKRVAVIGSAASAVQMIPEIAREARQLYVYQRTANWIFQKEDKDFTEEEREVMRAKPELGLEVRRELVDLFEALLPFNNQPMMDEFRDGALQNLDQVKDPSVRAKMMPQVPAFSQRPLFSDDYYPTFNRDNVELVVDEIECITPAGVKTPDGQTRDIDVLILATGYVANKYLAVIDVTGSNGLRLEDAWSEGAEAYLGITTSGFPNLFMLYGPNTNNGSILYMLEQQAQYIANKLAYMRENDVRRIEIKRDVMDSYNEQIQRDLDAVEVWRTLATRYYRAANGRIVTQWPHNMAAYEARTKKPDIEAYEIERAKSEA